MALLNYAEFHLYKKTFLITWQNSNICSPLWLDQNHNQHEHLAEIPLEIGFHNTIEDDDDDGKAQGLVMLSFHY